MPRGRRLSPAPQKPYLPYEPGMIGYEENEIVLYAKEPIVLLQELVEMVDAGQVEPPALDWMIEVRKAVKKAEADITLFLPTREEVPRNKDWWGPFLNEVARRANLAAACRKVGISHQLIYKTAKNYPSFARALEEAKRIAVGRLEERAWQRAEHDSDRLIEFLLKSYAPETYGPNNFHAKDRDEAKAGPQAANGPLVDIQPVEDYRISVGPIGPPTIEGNFTELPAVPGDALKDLAEVEPDLPQQVK